MSTGGGSQETQQTVSNEPWSDLKGPLRGLYSATGNALSNQLPYYPNQTYSNLTPLQEAGQYGSLDYAQNYYAPATQGYQQALGSYMDAPLNISQDPAVQAMMSANQQNASDWLTGKALPSITSGAVAGGQLGGSRQGIAQGQAIGDAAKALTQANAQTMLGAYGTAADLAGKGATLMPNALQMGFTPSQIASEIGGQYQGISQQGIDEAMKRYFYPEESNWSKLGQAASIYSGGGGYGQQTSTAPGASPLSGAIGGGLTGLGAAQFLSSPMGAGLFGGTPTLAGLGSAGTLGLYGIGGALLGGLLS